MRRLVTTPEVSPESAAVEVQAKLRNESAGNADFRAAVQVSRLSALGRAGMVPLSSVRRRSGGVVSAGEAFPLTAKLKVAKPSLWTLETARTATSPSPLVNETASSWIASRPFRHPHRRIYRRRWLPSQRQTRPDPRRLPSPRSRRARARLQPARRGAAAGDPQGDGLQRHPHHPQPAAPELLDLCDRMGFLVMDEFFDAWTQAKKPNGYATIFADWYEQDLRAMVRRDRNHPSVDHLEHRQRDRASRAMTEGSTASPPNCAAIVHERGPHAPDHRRLQSTVKSGYNGFQKTVDVFGYNYKPMLYAKFHAAQPDHPALRQRDGIHHQLARRVLLPRQRRQGGGQGRTSR